MLKYQFVSLNLKFHFCSNFTLDITNMAATNVMESVLRLCLSSFLLIFCLSDASEVVMEDVVPVSANVMSNVGYRIDGRVEVSQSLYLLSSSANQ